MGFADAVDQGQECKGDERLAEPHFPSEVSKNTSVRRSVMDHESTVVLIWLAAAIWLLVRKRRLEAAWTGGWYCLSMGV
jgi:hypothetical protein